MTTPGSALTVLSRIRAGRPVERPEYERCEMCGAPMSDQHGHVVNVSNRSLLCTCRPCYLLFTHDDAQLTYRAIPERYFAFPNLPTPVWEELELPVGTAFLFLNSALGRIVAFYPGPAGATESELPLQAWGRVIEAVPGLRVMKPDVEALLVHSDARDGRRTEAFLVPIDVCYELVGQLRKLWRGFDGGQEVREQLDSFFARVRAKSRSAVAG